jgi:hypothetical protein
MTLLIGTSAALSISLIINIALIWYAANAVRHIRRDQTKIYELISELEELQEMIGSYVNHLESVEGLEMFYGDETLRELMRHGTAIVEGFREYYDLYLPILNYQEDINDNKNNEDPSLKEETSPHHTA